MEINTTETYRENTQIWKFLNAAQMEFQAQRNRSKHWTQSHNSCISWRTVLLEDAAPSWSLQRMWQLPNHEKLPTTTVSHLQRCLPRAGITEGLVLLVTETSVTQVLLGDGNRWRIQPPTLIKCYTESGEGGGSKIFKNCVTWTMNSVFSCGSRFVSIVVNIRKTMCRESIQFGKGCLRQKNFPLLAMKKNIDTILLIL